MATMNLTVDETHIIVTGGPLDRDRVLPNLNGFVASGNATWKAPKIWACWVNAASWAREMQVEPAVEFAAEFAAENARQFARTKARYAETGEQVTLGEIDLFPGQIADARWLVDGGGSGFLFSDLRTGKSYTLAYTLALLPDAFPALIACPPHITFELERQFRAALPERRIVVLSNGMTGTQRKKALESNPEIVIMGYNLLAKHSKVLNFGGLSKAKRDKEITQGLRNPKELNAIGFKTVILDEAHNVKDPTSQQTRAVWALGDAATYRIAATGTPTSKRETGFADDAIDISDMWALLRFVEPLAFPAKSKFYEWYLELTTDFFGILRVAGLHRQRGKYWEAVFEPMYLRRKRTIKTEKDVRIIPVELDSKQRRVYNQLDKHSMADVGGALLSAEDALTLRQRKLQASLATLVLDDTGGVAGMQQPSAVLDALLAWIDEADTKAVVFSDSALFFRLIEQIFTDKEVAFVSFPGGLTNERKLAVTAAFRDNPDIKVILCSLKAANAGIDLSAAKRMAFASMSDDSTVMAQAADRNLGPTQTEDLVELAYFVAKDTVQEEIYANVLSKVSNTAKLFRENK